MKEIQIIGGGLAGLSLGIALRGKGVPVVLHERGVYPQHKVCGEFICGVEDSVLEDLGIQIDLEDAKIHQRLKWWMDGVMSVDKELPQSARGISRYVLDQRLAERFEQLGGNLKTQSRVKLDFGEGFVRASGKRKSGGKEWIGLKLHFYKSDIESLEMHSGTRGYIGLCEVAQGRVNACGLFKVDSKVKGKGRQLFFNYLRNSGLEYLANILSESESDEASFSATAGFSLGKQEVQNGFNIGDAQYLIPPFTGNGMSMALESSALAVDPLSQYSMGEMSWEAAQNSYHHRLKHQFGKRTALAAGMHPFIFNRIGRASLKILGKNDLLPINSLFTQLRTP
ncbi:MAG: flavin-dependent dehydrogenase [Crocinitomicaceae bacterium]|jgi:flavin-dependent dehydrogenase